jgi:hypothetical protein
MQNIFRSLAAVGVMMVLVLLPTMGVANVWVKKSEVSKQVTPPRPMLEALNPAAPEIIVERPELSSQALPTPVRVLIRFVAKDGAEIVLESVRLIYVTFFSDIDITDRVKDKITAEGIQDDNAELPSGSHHLIVRVRDTRGHERKKEFRFEVQ